MSLGIDNFTSSRGTFFDTEYRVKFKKKRCPQILSLSGGGVRGIIPIEIIKRMTEILDAQVPDFIDMIVGTSTSSLIGAGLLLKDTENPNKPKFTATDIRDKYLSLPSEIFSRTFLYQLQSLLGLVKPKYSSESFEKTLHTIFEDSKIGDLMKPIWFPTTVMPTEQDQNFHIYSFTKEKDHDLLIKDVVQACTAAPTYFGAKVINGVAYCDGGLFANNPVAPAKVYADRYFRCNYSHKILSIGTGKISYPMSLKEESDMGLYQWIKNGTLLNAIFDLQENLSQDLAMQLSLERLHILNVPIDSKHSSLDDASQNNLTYLRDTTIAWLEETKNDEKIHEICKSFQVYDPLE